MGFLGGFFNANPGYLTVLRTNTERAFVWCVLPKMGKMQLQTAGVTSHSATNIHFSTFTNIIGIKSQHVRNTSTTVYAYGYSYQADHTEGSEYSTSGKYNTVPGCYGTVPYGHKD